MAIRFQAAYFSCLINKYKAFPNSLSFLGKLRITFYCCVHIKSVGELPLIDANSGRYASARVENILTSAKNLHGTMSWILLRPPCTSQKWRTSLLSPFVSSGSCLILLNRDWSKGQSFKKRKGSGTSW